MCENVKNAKTYIVFLDFGVDLSNWKYRIFDELFLNFDFLLILFTSTNSKFYLFIRCRDRRLCNKHVINTIIY